MSVADLSVVPLSTALSGRHIDLVVSGSIGAVESVRLIRALRRLGASITPWLTDGGAQFVTPTALSWAAAAEARVGFAGSISHLATADAVIVAPASASFIAKIAHGLSSEPAAALVTSYLGTGKPVLMVPNMHASLYESPMVQANLERLAPYLQVLPARTEEGKLKFPEPATLADELAHRLNQQRHALAPTVVTMGTTRGYIDQVRYVSNYSSGRLGSLISEELYRCGLRTHVVAGPCLHKPRVYSEIQHIETNAELAAATSAWMPAAGALVMAASVLDFVPEQVSAGKISSRAELNVHFHQAPKLLPGLRPKGGIKVGFKLEVGLNPEQAQVLADRYFRECDLSLMVLNSLEQVSAESHTALLAERDGEEIRLGMRPISGKEALAARIVEHVRSALEAQSGMN